MNKTMGLAAMAALWAGLAAPAALADEKRELSAHVHGETVLKIAFEGAEVEMALEAPGFDIVGFEYEASTAEDRAKVEAALTALRSPTDLFALVGGGCSATAIEVELHIEGADEHGDHDDHGHAEAAHDDHGHEEHAHDAHGHDAHGHEEHAHDAHAHDAHGHDANGHDAHAEASEATHSAFEAAYRLRCDSLDAATTLDASGFFERFATAEILEATIVSDQGARVVEMDADQPQAALDSGA